MKLSPTAQAICVRVEPCLGDARVTGWIKADDKESGFAACELLGSLFGRKHVGGFSLDATFTDFPFSFDIRPEYLARRGYYESKEEVIERVTRVLKNGQARLTKERNATLKKLECGAFKYT